MLFVERLYIPNENISLKAAEKKTTPHKKKPHPGTVWKALPLF